MLAHTWENPEIYQIGTLNQVNQNTKQKKNPEEKPHVSDLTCHVITPWKWFKRLSDVSLWVCPQTVLYSSLPINTSLVSLLSVFVRILCLQSWRARALSLTIGLVASIGALTTMTWPQSVAGNQSPTLSYCRLRPMEIKTRIWTPFQCSFSFWFLNGNC